MIIGVLDGQAHASDEKFRIFDKRPVNSDTSTFTFAAV